MIMSKLFSWNHGVEGNIYNDMSHINFSSFSTVFQQYQDSGWMIVKGCVQENAFTIEKIFAYGNQFWDR